MDVTWQVVIKHIRGEGYDGKENDLAAVKSFIEDEALDLRDGDKPIDLDALYKAAHPDKRKSDVGQTAKQAESESLRTRIKELEENLRVKDEEYELSGRKKRAETPDGPETKAVHDIKVGKDRLADHPRAGYNRLGDFFMDVVKAGGGSSGPARIEKGSNLDLWQKAALSTYANESAGADGGFLVPDDMASTVDKRVNAEDSLLPRTSVITVSGNSYTEPQDETTPWGTTGIQSYWEGEAGTITQSKPIFRNRTWQLNKVQVLVPATNESLEDASALQSYINEKAPDMIDFKIGEGIVRGTGAGMPLGILNSAGTISIAAETNQPAATYKATNAQKQIRRMHAQHLRNSVFLMNPDVTVELHQLFVVGKTDAGTSLAAGGLVFNPEAQAGAPFGTLYGRPILFTQHCAQLGTVGDIILAALPQYRSVIKAGGLRSQISTHFWFDQDATAFRFTFRMGGAPKFETTITPRAGSVTYGDFLTVATRS